MVAAATLVFYCAAVWLLIEHTSEWGAVIRQWRNEYFDADGSSHGSMSFRTPMGVAFLTVALPYGILAYPAAVLASFLMLRHSKINSAASVRAACWGGTALMVAILARFVCLGVYTCVIASL